MGLFREFVYRIVVRISLLRCLVYRKCSESVDFVFVDVGCGLVIACGYVWLIIGVCVIRRV